MLVERWRAMPAWEKAQCVNELSGDCERLAPAGIRHDSPNVTPHQARVLLAARRFGRALARRAFGGDPILEGL